MSKDLQTLNGQNKLVLWAERILECRNSGQNVKAWCWESGVCEETYHDLGKDITVVGYWVHARRKFDKAVKSLPKGKVKGSFVSQGLSYCNLIFGIELRTSLREITSTGEIEQLFRLN